MTINTLTRRLVRLEKAIAAIVTEENEPIDPADLTERVKQFYADLESGQIPDTPKNLYRRRSLDCLIDLLKQELAEGQ